MKRRLFFQILLAGILAIGLVFSPLQATLVAQSARLTDETPAPVEDVVDGGASTDEPAADVPIQIIPEEVQPSETVPSDVSAVTKAPAETEATPQPVDAEPAVIETAVVEITDTQPISQSEIPVEPTQPREEQPAAKPSEIASSVQSLEIQPTPVAVLEKDNSPEEKNQPIGESQWVNGQLLVKVDPSINLKDLTARLIDLGYAVSETGTISGALLVNVPMGQELASISAIQMIDGIHYAEPVYTVTALDLIPNDPAFPSQPNMVTINAPGGWDYFTGSSGVIVAIIDSGVDLTNPDFAGRLVQGYDFINGDDIPMDDNGHGTHVAGIVAATGNNGIGVAGLDWSAKIMPVKVLNSSGKGDEQTVHDGIMYAVDHGAQIINLSLGMTGSSSYVEEAINYAYLHGVTVIAASGNSGTAQINFPASMPHVIAVGAVDDSENQLSFSNYGNELDLVAPGKDILSTGTSGPIYMTGTSMSAAHVSGLASLLKGIYPISPDQIKTVMESTSKDLGTPGWDTIFGSGLIQVRNAILRLLDALKPVYTKEPDKEAETPAFTPYPTFTPTPTPTLFPIGYDFSTGKIPKITFQ